MIELCFVGGSLLVLATTLGRMIWRIRNDLLHSSGPFDQILLAFYFLTLAAVIPYALIKMIGGYEYVFPLLPPVGR